MAKQITKDEAYDAVAPDDFAAMIAVDRYGHRDAAFDKIIAATHSHFWDPLDARYIDFSQKFDLENQMLIPEDLVPAVRTDHVASRLSDKEKIAFVNESARWQLSAILHGEQGALSLSASLCHILKDPGAQEYAANQTREEARHVTAFSRYIAARWGKPLPVGATLGALLDEVVNAPEVYKKIVGMQMLVEGLAMGAFATLCECANDPVLVRLCQLVMTDEAFHHKFGKIWADRTIPKLTKQEAEIVEDWAARCFQTLLFNLINPEQMKEVYDRFGLDHEIVMDQMAAFFSDEGRREQMERGTNIFRVLVKTLVKSGIITQRTRSFYALYVDLDELKREGDEMVGDAIAEDAIKQLQAINSARGRVWEPLRAL